MPRALPTHAKSHHRSDQGVRRRCGMRFRTAPAPARRTWPRTRRRRRRWPPSALSAPSGRDQADGRRGSHAALVPAVRHSSSRSRTSAGSRVSRPGRIAAAIASKSYRYGPPPGPRRRGSQAEQGVQHEAPERARERRGHNPATAEVRSVADVEADEHRSHARLEHDLRRLGVHEEVELRRRGDVARHFEGAAHDRDPLKPIDEGGVGDERRREVGQRSDRDDRQAVRRARRAQDQLDGPWLRVGASAAGMTRS